MIALKIVRGWFPLHFVECQGSHFSLLKKFENQNDWITNARHILDEQQKMRYYNVMKLKQYVVLEKLNLNLCYALAYICKMRQRGLSSIKVNDRL